MSGAVDEGADDELSAAVTGAAVTTGAGGGGGGENCELESRSTDELDKGADMLECCCWLRGEMG